MVKKLFKHEFLAYMRSLLPMHLIMLGIAAMTRFVFLFENKSTTFDIVRSSSETAMILSCIVCIVLTAWNVITRFYKNMFTNEGYLSFTLPVSVSQHIFVKGITGVAVVFADVLFIIAGICVATFGEFTVELFKAIGYILKQAQDLVGWQLWLYIIEGILLVSASLLGTFLMFYSCIALGQLSNKNRIFLAVGAYFGFYFIGQVLGTVMIIVMSTISYQDWFIKMMDNLGKFAADNPHLSAHLFFLICLVVSAVGGLIYYAISYTVMKKKLNLE